MLPEVTLRDISREDRQGSAPVVTITGLPGSGSEVVGMEIARTTGGRLVDDEEITRRMCQRLGRTVGELKAFEASCRSVWSRMLRALLAPWERYGVYDGGYDWVGARPGVGVFQPHEYLAKQEYLQGLKSVIGELATERNLVLHGHGSHVLLPLNAPALRVFVNASETARRERVAAKEGLSLKNAQRWLSRADRESLALFRDLFGTELLDMRQYDVVLNLDRRSFETAAQMVVGGSAGPGEGPRNRRPPRLDPCRGFRRGPGLKGYRNLHWHGVRRGHGDGKSSL